MAFDLKAKQAELAARRAAAALSPEDKAEQEARDVAAREEAEVIEAERAKRDLDLARRLDAARTAHPGTKFESLPIKDHHHTFIIQDPGAKAYADWEKGIQPAVLGGNPDRTAVKVAYASAAVYDWNGLTDWTALSADGKSTVGAELNCMLRGYPGIATNIVNAANVLVGLALEERKS